MAHDLRATAVAMLTDVSIRDTHRSRPRAESIGVTLPGFVVRLATSSNAAARSYCPLRRDDS